MERRLHATAAESNAIALREGARLQLASAILSIAKDGNLDVATLTKAGIDAMRSRELRHTP